MNAQPLLTLARVKYTSTSAVRTRELQYPESVAAGRFDPEFAIRGLGVDRRYGILVKLSYRLQVSKNCAYFGRRPVPPERLEALYGRQCTLSKVDHGKRMIQA